MNTRPPLSDTKRMDFLDSIGKAFDRPQDAPRLLLIALPYKLQPGETPPATIREAVDYIATDIESIERAVTCAPETHSASLQALEDELRFTTPPPALPSAPCAAPRLEWASVEDITTFPETRGFLPSDPGCGLFLIQQVPRGAKPVRVTFDLIGAFVPDTHERSGITTFDDLATAQAAAEVYLAQWLTRQSALLRDSLSGPSVAEPPRETSQSGVTCSVCNWTNVRCLNLGTDNKPVWMCHGCIKRERDLFQQLREDMEHGSSGLKDDGFFENWYNHYVSWHEVVRAFPKDLAGYMESPLEMVAQLVNQRDELREKMARLTDPLTPFDKLIADEKGAAA